MTPAYLALALLLAVAAVILLLTGWALCGRAIDRDSPNCALSGSTCCVLGFILAVIALLSLGGRMLP